MHYKKARLYFHLTKIDFFFFKVRCFWSCSGFAFVTILQLTKASLHSAKIHLSIKGSLVCYFSIFWLNSVKFPQSRRDLSSSYQPTLKNVSLRWEIMSFPAHSAKNVERDSFCSALLSFPMCLVLLAKAFKPGRIAFNICVLTKLCKQLNDRYDARQLWV